MCQTGQCVFTGQVLSGVTDTAVCLTNREEMRLPEVLRLDEMSSSSGMKVTPSLTVYGSYPKSGMICIIGYSTAEADRIIPLSLFQ